MIQPQTQTRDYWVSNFTVTETDIENLYNYFLEVEVPQTIDDLVKAVINSRVSAENQELQRRLAGRTVYQPRKTYALGEQVIFPALKFAAGAVTEIRQGYNPEHGTFDVISVELNGRAREFAANFASDHVLNLDDSQLFEQVENMPRQSANYYKRFEKENLFH